MYSKDEQNCDEKSRRDKCGVRMLCRHSQQYSEILIRGDDINISPEKCGQQKRRGALELCEALVLHETTVISQVIALFTRLLYPSSTLIV